MIQRESSLILIVELFQLLNLKHGKTKSLQQTDC